MNWYLQVRNLFVVGLAIIVWACEHTYPAQPAGVSACRLTGMTDQNVSASGRVTDELQRAFTYTNGLLTTITEGSASPVSQTATYQIERTAGRITRATGNSAVLTLSYTAGTNGPTSATLSRGGVVTSTFAMQYKLNDRLGLVSETRIGLPNPSLIDNRTYNFLYDNAGNLTTERAHFVLQGGIMVDQETEYTFDTRPSPYRYVPDRPLLTLVALSQDVETYPGRFWHQNAPISYKSWFLSGTSRVSLRESATYTPTYDSANKLMSQNQTLLLYQASVPDPVTKTNRQAFTYQCD